MGKSMGYRGFFCMQPLRSLLAKIGLALDYPAYEAVFDGLFGRHPAVALDVGLNFV